MNHPNYLAFHRRRNGLTAQALAQLLGYAHRSAVRRCEAGQRTPTLRFALACQAVFGVSPAQMFPGIYAEIEEAVLGAGAVFDLALRRQPRKATGLQRKLLLRMVERTSERPIR